MKLLWRLLGYRKCHKCQTYTMHKHHCVCPAFGSYC